MLFQALIPAMEGTHQDLMTMQYWTNHVGISLLFLDCFMASNINIRVSLSARYQIQTPRVPHSSK